MLPRSLLVLLACLGAHGKVENTLTDLLRNMLYPTDMTEDTVTPLLQAEYDFIVVGSGPGGATVTNRLTEVGEWSVLLLEAGGEESALTDIPVFAAHFQLTDYNWGYRGQPLEGACLGMRDGRCNWPRGKGMGGTSIINYMIYTRGHPRDYDGWVEEGNQGWGWEEVLPYFLKSERARGDFAKPPYHSSRGYLDVERIKYHTPLARAFLEGAQERGESLIDYNSGNMLGFSYLQVTQRNGARCSSSKAFLRPIRRRPNLHIAKHAHVTKVLMDPATKRAYGVQFQRDGRLFTVRARREVILSAGALNTPQLLMLSGIGPREHLESLGIPVLQDSPGVGFNLQEHVTTCGLTFLVNQTSGIIEDRLTKIDPFYQYLQYGAGPLAISGGVEALGFIRTPVATTPEDYPDMELIFIAGHAAVDGGRVVHKALGISEEVYKEVFEPITDRDGWSIWPMVLQPQSRGRVMLKSNNPFSWPLLYGNYLNVTHDLDVLVEGIKYAMELSRTTALQRFNSTLNPHPLPACKGHQFASDEYWRCVVRQLTTIVHHQCGTAKMGPSSDPMAVVDPELRVHGVQGLRVVDASIMPRMPAAHTNAPTFMIGEKAGDIIKKAYGKLY